MTHTDALPGTTTVMPAATANLRGVFPDNLGEMAGGKTKAGIVVIVERLFTIPAVNDILRRLRIGGIGDVFAIRPGRSRRVVFRAGVRPCLGAGRDGE